VIIAYSKYLAIIVFREKLKTPFRINPKLKVERLFEN
jgi:hypothetical protein